jgi:hypothetical protein
MAVSFIGGGNWSTWRKPLTFWSNKFTSCHTGSMIRQNTSKHTSQTTCTWLSNLIKRLLYLYFFGDILTSNDTPFLPMSYVMVFLCSVSSVKMKGDCSFCWYWWNWWPSLFKLSFHNLCNKQYNYSEINHS